jgi:hypothetical protein
MNKVWISFKECIREVIETQLTFSNLSDTRAMHSAPRHPLVNGVDPVFSSQ